MSTSNVSTSKDRIDIRIPKKSRIYKNLYVDNNGNDEPKWRRLDAILTRAEDNSADTVTKIFDEFVARIGIYYPEKKKRIEKLRALILWHIIWEEDLPDIYWDKIRSINP